MLSPDIILQGRYRIMRQLGQGGMGAVYEAVDQRLDTVVALKETLFTDEKLRKQFEREARLLARLHHPALPRVSDHFNEGDGQFLVMQYIAGEDFAEMLKHRNGPFTQPEVLQWADQLCDALDYLHTQEPQIIHRDIKPHNLKLTARGQVVLLDFGLAKGSAGQMSVVTTSASIYGYTPNYAPLEQVQGLGTDARSDIYSLAATLYHLATNVKPPDALSRAAAIVNGLPDPLQPAHAVAPKVSPGLSEVLSKGMSQKRDDRYVSAAAMRDSLRSALAARQTFGEAETVLTSGMRASTESTSERGTRLVGSRTASVGSEAQTILTPEKTKARQSSSRGETVTLVRSGSSTRGAPRWLAAAAAIILLVGMAGGFYVYRTRQRPAPQNPMPASQTVEPAADSRTTDASATENSNQPLNTNTIQPKNDKTKTETSNQRAGSTRQSTEKGSEAKNAPTPQPSNQQPTQGNADGNRQRGGNQNSGADATQNDPSRNQTGRPNSKRGGGGGPNVRIMPNGTRIETLPDGTHLVTFPNGRTREFPPGVRPNRRRNPGP